MIKVDMRASFFDSPKVIKAVDKATRRVLSKFGAFVRTRARSSIRKRKKSSPPGSPPSSKTGTLRRFLYFAFDFASKSVVVGPQALQSVKDADAPSRLEYGGTLKGDGRTITLRNPGGLGKKPGNTQVNLTGTLKYPARPYMGPALKAELPGLPAMWRDSVRP
jgi:hypothetical protein